MPTTPSSSLRSRPLGEFLSTLAAKSPTPGGGAVASTTGAIAASLAHMVVAYSLNKKSLAEHQPALQQASAALLRTSDLFLALAEEDAAAYAQYNELSRLPETDPRRAAELPGALAASINAPRAVLGASADLLRLLESLRPITNPHLRSDLAIAAVLAEAAAKSAHWNIHINLPNLPDPAQRSKLDTESRTLLAQSALRRAAIEQACA
ncbi:MAG TPA: cyclodeaminase/cyclohydrolase family protein [Phycisphaerales bacterium]|nr:cyclodeaminase/cyclohydrolase family protein [Phycisphaerales bacterium]